jgi:hypothetical protein
MAAPVEVVRVERAVRSPLFLFKQQSPFLADKRLKGRGKLQQEHFQAHVIFGYVD